MRIDSPLFNVKHFATNMERLFTLMWNKFANGEKPNYITELANLGEN